MEGHSIKELFYNYPTKHWHFEKILQSGSLSRTQTSEWLKKLQNDNIITRVKPVKKMPYFISNFNHYKYQNSKKLYALNSLYESGLIDYLTSFEGVKSIIIFGSFTRWDWYEGSDIDVFIYGNVNGVHVGKFSKNLKKEIQLFVAKDEKDLKKFGPKLLRNVIKGMTIKGEIPREVIKIATI